MPLSHFKLTSIFFTLTLIISTTSTAWNYNNSTSPMFVARDNKVELDITLPVELETKLYPDVSLISSARNGQLENVIDLLKKGVDPNTRDYADHTALMAAAQRGHLEIVKILLRWGAGPNLQNETGDTPLIYAAYGNHLEITRLLLERRADPYLRDQNGYNSLIWAVLKGHSEVVSTLLDRGMDPNSGIFAAIREGHLKILSHLLARGANPNLRNGRGYTPFTLATSHNHLAISETLLEWGADINLGLIDAVKGGHAQVVKTLLAMGIDPNLQDDDGNSLLMWATVNNRTEVVAILLEWKANLNLQNNRELMPLGQAILNDNLEIVLALLDAGADPDSGIFTAAITGHFDIFKALLVKGANPNLKSNNEYTPLTLTILRDYPAITDLLLEWGADPNVGLFGTIKQGFVPAVRSLLSIGADPNLQDNDGNTPLMLATANNHLNMARVLSEWGADPNLKDREDNTPLMHAAVYGQLPFVEFFLSLEETDVNLSNHEGYTALMRAFYTRDLKVITALLDAGADPNAQDNKGLTALMNMAYAGELEIMIALLARGADVNSQDPYDYTPLMRATYNGDIRVITTLLEWGANPSLKDHDGNTAVWWANRHNHPDIVALLETATEE